MTEAEERWLTIEDVVNLLHVHEQTVRRWIKEGNLPGILLGRKAGYRIRERDLTRFLEARSVETGAGKVAA